MMNEQDDDAPVDAARWLQEAGRRSWKVQATQPEVELAPARHVEERNSVRKVVGKRLVLSAALALSYMQYYFLDVMVQINALPAIIVFYGQPAPGLGGAHAPIGAGVLEMVMPIAGRSAQAASSRSDATSASRIVSPLSTTQATPYASATARTKMPMFRVIPLGMSWLSAQRFM
jgi:hypothetical protein